MPGTEDRSTFVTVVAWILIVLSGFGTLIALLQNVMVQVMLHGSDLTIQPPQDGAPAWASFMVEHVGLVFLLVLVVAATTLVASIGLLRRANWARLMVIALMLLGIVWTLGGLALQAVTILSVREQAALGVEAPGMVPMMIAVAVVSALMAIAFVVLFGWIARRLASPGIAAEFR